jgi:hypothetical protein
MNNPPDQRYRDAMDPKGAFIFTPVELGLQGSSQTPELNAIITGFIPYMYKLMQENKLWPSETISVGKDGFEGVIESYEFQTAGKGGNKKVVVKIADE